MISSTSCSAISHTHCVMKIALWIHWLSIALICMTAWLFLPHLGSFLRDMLGGKPLPGITQIALDYRALFLAPPILLAGAAIWLTRSPVQATVASIFAAVSVLTIAATVSLLFLATVLPLIMHGPIFGGRTPSV